MKRSSLLVIIFMTISVNLFAQDEVYLSDSKDTIERITVLQPLPKKSSNWRPIWNNSPTTTPIKNVKNVKIDYKKICPSHPSAPRYSNNELRSGISENGNYSSGASQNARLIKRATKKGLSVANYLKIETMKKSHTKSIREAAIILEQQLRFPSKENNEKFLSENK